MGALIFGAWRRRIEFDDRTLSHVRTAVGMRMSRGVPFRLTWGTLHEAEYRSHAILVQPAALLEYRFDDSRLVVLNRLWLRELLRPGLGRDMVVTDEPRGIRRSDGTDPPPRRRRRDGSARRGDRGRVPSRHRRPWRPSVALEN